MGILNDMVRRDTSGVYSRERMCEIMDTVYPGKLENPSILDVGIYRGIRYVISTDGVSPCVMVMGNGREEIGNFHFLPSGILRRFRKLSNSTIYLMSYDMDCDYVKGVNEKGIVHSLKDIIGDVRSCIDIITGTE